MAQQQIAPVVGGRKYDLVSLDVFKTKGDAKDVFKPNTISQKQQDAMKQGGEGLMQYALDTAAATHTVAPWAKQGAVKAACNANARAARAATALAMYANSRVDRVEAETAELKAIVMARPPLGQ